MLETITAERRNKLAQVILTNGSIRIREMSKMFGVSTETIRKDLIYLDEKGIVKKSHGGALANSEFEESPITFRALENLEKKNKIAQRALDYVPNNGVIIIDAGSTLMCLAKLVAIRKGLTIITNSISAVNLLAGSDNTIYLVGGEISGITMSSTGLWASNALNMIKADVAFLGTSGFQSHNGPCAKTFADASVKRDIINNSNTTVVLADSSKFETNAIVQYALWKDVDLLITDNGVKDELVNLVQKEIKVVIS